MSFPIDVSKFKPFGVDFSQTALTPEQREQLTVNVQVMRDTIIFFTAIAVSQGMPLIIEIGVTLDVILGALVINNTQALVLLVYLTSVVVLAGIIVAMASAIIKRRVRFSSLQKTP